jgi:hypothetical protein|nr:extensin family protein [Neorhizobium tomejilense]
MAKLRNVLLAAVVSSVGLLPFGAFAAQQPDSEAARGDGEVVTEADNQSMGNSSATECIAQAESNGDIGVVNKQGFMGKFQIGEAKLIDTGWAIGSSGAGSSFDNQNIVWSDKAKQHGIDSMEDFLSNEAVQDKIKAEIDQWNTNRLGAAQSMIGQSIDCSQTGGSASTPLTASMLVQGAQFGHGKVNAWAKNGGSCINGAGSATNDGNNKCVTYMMCKAANCSTIEKDMSKKTCSVTMPMIKAISCSNYTGQNLALCNAAKPYLMTDGECNAAEAMSEKAQKGPNKEKCENLTFGPGTGSWSFALACSWASEAVADQDGSANSTTPVMPDDPECINKLKSMGVQFTELGTLNNGTAAGKACIVKNAVSSSGTAIPFGANLTMDCNLLLATEQFGQKIKSLGVTSYWGVSTLACRTVINNSGPSSTLSHHATGKAFDWSGVMIGGQKLSMIAVKTPGTPQGQIATQLKAIACATFSGVLTPTFSKYQSTANFKQTIHNHTDVAGKYCE